MSQISEPNSYQPQWTTWHRQLATVLLIILGVYAVSLLAPVINMLILAIMLAFLLFLPSRSLARRAHIPYALAVMLVYLLMVIIIVVVLLVVIPALITSVSSLLGEIQQAYNEAARSLQAINPDEAVIIVVGQPVDVSEIVRQLQSLTSPLGATPTEELTDPLRLEQLQLGQLVNQAIGVVASLTGTLTSAISGVTGVFSTFGLAIFVSFLILLDMPITARSVAQNVPLNYRREYSLLVAKILHVWNGFFRGQLIIGLIIGLLTWIQLRVMGIHNAELLAFITGVISLIPTIGGIIALLPLGVVPFFQGSNVLVNLSPGLLALLVVVINLIISQVIWNVVAPKILGDALDLPLPVVIVGVFIGAAAGGILGAFLVAPIMGTFKVLLQYVLAKIGQRDPYPGQEAPFDWDIDLLAKPRRPIKIWWRPGDATASKAPRRRG